ncbi:TraR/DksA C4-type zinc finger protein [Burkholderia sp. Ac-20345]|nr:TraR/DksA C4-type zinc finger protein [Burkholderia sp. Ac-20345]
MYCCECESPIPLGRREAVPGVQTCLACQIDLERTAPRR